MRTCFVAMVLLSGCGAPPSLPAAVVPEEPATDPPASTDVRCQHGDASQDLDSRGNLIIDTVFHRIPTYLSEVEPPNGQDDWLDTFCITLDDGPRTTGGSSASAAHRTMVHVDISDISNMHDPTVSNAAQAALDPGLRSAKGTRQPLVQRPFESPFGATVTDAVLDEVAGHTWRDIITWSILHELAHLYLSHPSARANGKSSRADEFAADRLAAHWMKDSGLSLHYVAAYLRARATSEAIAEPVDRSDGTHPSWNERWNHFVADHETYFEHGREPSILSMIYAVRVPTIHGPEVKASSFTILFTHWDDLGLVFLIDGKKPFAELPCSLRLSDNSEDAFTISCRANHTFLNMQFSSLPATMLDVDAVLSVPKLPERERLYDHVIPTNEFLYASLRSNGLIAYQSNTMSYMHGVLESDAMPRHFAAALRQTLTRVDWRGKNLEPWIEAITKSRNDGLRALFAYNAGELTESEFWDAVTTADEDELRSWREIEALMGAAERRRFWKEASVSRGIQMMLTEMGSLRP